MNDNTSNNNDAAPSEQQQQQQPQQHPRRIVRFRVPAGARIHVQSPRHASLVVPRPGNGATTQQQQQHQQQEEEQEESLRHVIGEGETTSPIRYDGAFGLSELRRRRRWVRQQDRGAENTTTNSSTTATNHLTRNTNALQQQQQQHDNDATAMLQDRFQQQQGQTWVNTTTTNTNSNANNNFNNINSNNNNNTFTIGAIAQDVLQNMLQAHLQQEQRQPQPQPVTLPPLQVRPLPDTKQVLRNNNDNHHHIHHHHIHPETTTLTCCICCEYLSTDVQQCRHNICTARFCGTCLQKYLQQQQQQRRNASAMTTTTALMCPMCQQDTSPGFVADTALQNHTRHLSRPCRYAECPVVLPLAALTTHEATCPAQRVACRYATLGCPWQGTRAAVMDHQEGKHHQNHQNQDQDSPPPPPRPCPYHALAPWIEQQRTAAATMQRHVQILSRQLLERQQHAALLEHAMRRTQERLRVFETRLAQAQFPTQPPAAPEQQQRTTTATATATATTIRNYTTHGYVHLTPLVQTWVRALACPAVLLHDTHAVARTWASVPTRLAAVGTVLDMIHHHYVDLATSGEDRSVPLPPLLLTIFLLLWVACREWNDQQFGPIASIAWGMILHWFRHSDQCLTIWASTVVATTVGCELWGGRRHELHQQQRGLSSAMALAWVWVSCGMAHTLWVAVQWASVHVFAQALAKLFWPTQQGLFHLAICLACFLYFWESRDVVLLWIFFWSMHRLVGFVAARLARRVRACPTKIAVWLCSTIVLLFLSWSIADCLYVPLESMLDWILVPGMDEQWQDGTDHATGSLIADPL